MCNVNIVVGWLCGLTTKKSTQKTASLVFFCRFFCRGYMYVAMWLWTVVPPLLGSALVACRGYKLDINVNLPPTPTQPHTTGQRAPQSQGDFNASSLRCGSANSRRLLALLTTSTKSLPKKEIRSPLSALLPRSGSLLAGSRTLDYCYEKLMSAMVKPRSVLALQNNQ